MIEIIDDRNTTISESPSLPFVTEQDGDFFLYFLDTEDRVAQLSLKDGEQLLDTFPDVEYAIQRFGVGEKIVNIQIRVVD